MVYLPTVVAVVGLLSQPGPVQEQSVTPVPLSDLASLAPFTQFARAAYCSGLATWSCGDACIANADFQLTLAGGNGNDVQQYFVGFSPSQNSIIVAHEGTDPVQLLADLTDMNIPARNLNPILFPGVPSSVLVHGGFRNEHALTATVILTEVKRLMSVKGVNTVTIVGHSLGAALAELDALFLTLNLPSSATVRSVTYGTPRVGNPAFVSYFDSKVPNFKRINNKRDPVPIVPTRLLGFQHPQGETHLLSPGNAVACSGDDNATDNQCTNAAVPILAFGNMLDHLGPYEGISIGTLSC